MNDKCFACGGSFVAVAGPTHEYMLSSPGCWNAYGEVLAREYESPMLFGAVHRLTVDAYALQHPGDASDRRARQSVWVHYAALYLSLRNNVDRARIPSVMQKLTLRTFPALPPAPAQFGVTLEDVLAQGETNHVSAVKAWADCALKAWAELEDQTVAMLKSL
ncbi:MAG: DUF5946 family protein [Erythrobacter sp.]